MCSAGVSDDPVIRCVVIDIADRASAVLIADRPALHGTPHRRVPPTVEQIFYLIPLELILYFHRYPPPCDLIISDQTKTKLKKRPFRKKIVFYFLLCQSVTVNTAVLPSGDEAAIFP